MKKKNLFKINRALDGVLSFAYRTSGIAQCRGQQREGRGPLPSIERGIHPFKKMKTEVVGRFEKR